MRKKLILQASLWLPVILWMVLIFNFSSGTVPSASAVYWQDFAVKKTGHVLLFGALAVLLYRALIGNGVVKKKAVVWSIALSFLYGATDEFHQMFTQGRESRLRDVFIDGLGAAVFIFVIYKILPKMPKVIVQLATKVQLI